MVADDVMHMEGRVKQQCIEDGGLYEWRRKHVSLVSKGNDYFLLLKDDMDNNSNFAKVSLSGSRYAKEWSFSSSIAGYGYDIVWDSGTIWSFLVDSEINCKQWVNSINNAINATSSKNSTSVELTTDFGKNKIEQSSQQSSIVSNNTTSHLHSPVTSVESLMISPEDSSISQTTSTEEYLLPLPRPVSISLADRFDQNNNSRLRESNDDVISDSFKKRFSINALMSSSFVFRCSQLEFSLRNKTSELELVNCRLTGLEKELENKVKGKTIN